MTTPANPNLPPKREVRFAVVMYGGISLAIYMHGITKEIHNLVIASERYEKARQDSPDSEAPLEDPYVDERPVLSAYWNALRRAEEDSEGPGGRRHRGGVFGDRGLRRVSQPVFGRRGDELARDEQQGRSRAWTSRPFE